MNLSYSAKVSKLQQERSETVTNNNPLLNIFPNTMQHVQVRYFDCSVRFLFFGNLFFCFLNIFPKNKAMQCKSCKFVFWLFSWIFVFRKLNLFLNISVVNKLIIRLTRSTSIYFNFLIFWCFYTSHLSAKRWKNVRIIIIIVVDRIDMGMQM